MSILGRTEAQAAYVAIPRAPGVTAHAVGAESTGADTTIADFAIGAGG